MTRLVFRLRRHRIAYVVAATVAAAIGAKTGGIHHVMGPAFGFWDGPL
jgi:hypothetical protein